jgi:hypothetical protein
MGILRPDEREYQQGQTDLRIARASVTRTRALLLPSHLLLGHDGD